MFANILFALAGLVLIGFGAYVQIAAKNYLNFLGDNYVNTPIFIIIVGGVIFAVAFFGCCGSAKENSCMMKTYAVFLILIVIAQIGAGIAAFAVKGPIEKAIEKNMNNGMKNYGKTEFQGVTDTWDIVQKGYKCCGVTNSSDWESIDMFTAGQAPDSCCVGGQKENCGKEQSPKFFSDGCYSKFKGDFVGNIGIVGGVALGIAAAEILIVAISFCLSKKMGESGRYY